MWVWIDDEGAQIEELVPVHWNSRHDQEEKQGSKTQAHSCARKRRNLIQWEVVIRKPGYNTLNSVFRETSQVQCLPASNIWESSQQHQHGSTCPAVHCIAQARRQMPHVHDIIEASNVPALVCVPHRTLAMRWMKLFSVHGHARQSRRT